MKKAKIWAAVAVPLLAASATFAAAPAGAATPGPTTKSGLFTCKLYAKGGTTIARTPVHVGPSSGARVTGYIAKGKVVHLYYECINSSGNIWYEITGDIDSGRDTSRFIWSAYV